MRKIDNVEYLTIGEVSKLVGRGAQTIKSWFDWYDQQDQEVKDNKPLPKVYTLDERGTRYFKREDIPMLIEFKDSIGYGTMAEFNRKRWGKRGESK